MLRHSENILRRYPIISIDGVEYKNDVTITQPDMVGDVLLKRDEEWVRLKYRSSRRLNIEAYERGAITREEMERVVGEIDRLLSSAVFVE